MHDAVFVGGGDTGRDLFGDVEKLRRLQSRVAQPLRERLALAILHDDEGQPGAFADLVNRGDVRVTNGCRAAGLAKESGPALVGCHVLRVQDFQGDGAIESRITGEVNGSHSAFAENPENLEAIERLRDFGHAPPADSTMAWLVIRGCDSWFVIRGW